MAGTTKSFNGYNFSYYTHYGNVVARVGLHMDGILVARVDFIEEGVALPDNTVSANQIILNYAASRFNDFITTLRKEKALVVFCDPATKMGSIAIPSNSVVTLGTE